MYDLAATNALQREDKQTTHCTEDPT